MGDLVEAIAYKDKRFDARELAQPINPEMLSNPFYTQALKFAKVWEPTKGKWAAFIDGNHEGKAMCNFFCNPMQTIADRLGGAYIGGSDQSGWIQIKMVRTGGKKISTQYNIYCIHGWGGGETRGVDANRLQKLAWKKGADLVLIAHSHRPMFISETVETLNIQGRVINRPIDCILCYALIGQHGYLARRGGNEPSTGLAIHTVKVTASRGLFSLSTKTSMETYRGR